MLSLQNTADYYRPGAYGSVELDTSQRPRTSLGAPSQYQVSNVAFSSIPIPDDTRYPILVEGSGHWVNTDSAGVSRIADRESYPEVYAPTEITTHKQVGMVGHVPTAENSWKPSAMPGRYASTARKARRHLPEDDL